MKLLLATAATLLVGATAAYASPVVVSGEYSIGYTPTIGTAPSFVADLTKTGTSSNVTTNVAFSERLNVGVTTAQTQFFAVSPASSCGRHCGRNKTATGKITVTFTFDSPILPSSTLSDAAAYIANYRNDTDSVTWNSPSTLTIDFVSGAILDISLINAQDWTIYPEIAFELVQGPTNTPVPEPASLALLGGGLFGLAFLYIGNRRKVAKVA